MVRSRALAALAVVAPLLAVAACARDRGQTCKYCDAGATDRPVDRPADLAPIDAGATGETASDGEGGPGPSETGDLRPPTLRDATPGEARDPTPILDGGFLLVDDFATGEATGWEVLAGKNPYVPRADWQVILGTSGSVYAQGVLDPDVWHITYRQAGLGPDQIVEAQLRVVEFFAEEPSDVAALFARYDASTDSGYFVALRGDGSVSVRRRDGGVSASWGPGSPGLVRPGVWYTVRLEAIGSDVNAFIDGVPVYAVTDDHPLPGDGIALGTFGASMEVERVAVTPP